MPEFDRQPGRDRQRVFDRAGDRACEEEGEGEYRKRDSQHDQTNEEKRAAEVRATQRQGIRPSIHAMRVRSL